MKTLNLDYSKWRCGGEYSDDNNGTGIGYTLLHNYNEYECCLGQFIPQMDKNVTVEMINNLGEPNDLEVPIKGLSYKKNNSIRNNMFCKRAIMINDNDLITVSEKIIKLRKLFAKKGYRIRVINKPKTLA